MSIKSLTSIKSILWSLFRPCIHFLFKMRVLFSGQHIRIGTNVYIDSKSELTGDNLLNDNVRLIHTTLDRYSYVSPNTILVCCKIGRYVSIGPGCVIGTGLHPLTQVSTSPFIYNDMLFKSRRDEDFMPVVINADAWIGANAVVFGGVTLGIGCVVGAGAVVTKDVPPYAVVAGVPARVMRYRFTEEKIQCLLASKWWLDEPERVKEKFNKNDE